MTSKFSLRPTSLRTFVIVVGILALALFMQQTVSQAEPNSPQGASTLGDFVWHDSNVNGVKDESAEWGSSGIDGVKVNLYKDDMDHNFEPGTDDTLVGSLTTGDDSSTTETEHGWYDFVNITANGNAYWVEIDDSNFDSGGALEGYVYTGNLGNNAYTGPEPRYVYLGQPIMDYNDADFGYAKPGIKLVKTAGNAADGETEYIGSAQNVTFTYTYTNTGETHLKDITVVDDNGTPSDTSDDFTVCSVSGPLAPNASGTCTVSRMISADMTNTAKVTANPTDGNGADLPGDDVTDTDDATVDIVSPAIKLVKTADSAADGAIDYINSGDNVVYHYTVTNTGDTYLSNIKVKDDNGTPSNTSDDFEVCTITGPLAPNASQSCTYTVNNVTADVTNTATSTGNPTDSNGNDLPDISDVSDTDDAVVKLYASLGDFVWEDTDADGEQDAGETGIDGVTVELFKSDNTSVGTMQTANGGQYKFENLVPGDYYVKFTLPTDYVFSSKDAVSDDAKDSDADPSTGKTVTTTLTSGENDLTWDAGMYKKARLGDYVWEDKDADGIQDAGETGISGVTVRLYKDADGDGHAEPNGDDGSAVSTTTTATDGAYHFSNLDPGAYFVEFVKPSGYDAASPSTASGASDPNDSDADTNTGLTDVTTLTSGEDDPTWDAGFYKYASLGDFVWEDTDADGEQDAGETGIDGVTVELFKSDNTSVGTMQTANGGQYKFENLVPGDYYVKFTLPTDYVFSSKDAVSDDAKDSDADPSTGKTVTTTLTSGENDLTWDAGMYKKARLGDYVWEDKDADGIQDAGETGISGVTVRLYKDADGDGHAEPNGDDGSAVSTTTTATDGAYHFSNLDPGAYFVEFVKPSGYDAASPSTASGASDPNDSDADTNTGLTDVTTLTSGEDDPTWDAGFYKYASLGDFVWFDLDEDGVQDANEPGIKGVTVTLKDSSGNTVGTTTTDSNGAYSFTNLKPGDYTVVFSTPSSDWSISPKDQGSDDTDSDADPTTGSTGTVNLSSGEDDDTIDAGMSIPSSYTISKENTTVDQELTPGDAISFTITIKNTGKTWLAEIPLKDQYDTTYLTYVNANPSSDDNVDDGLINWADVTGSGQLAPNATISIVVNFTAKASTENLANHQTINTATAYDVKADPDGPNGPNGSIVPLDDESDDAPVHILNPVGETMDGFSLTTVDGVVILSWHSMSEADILGFNVLRRGEHGRFERVNTDLIFARNAGADLSAGYSFSDSGLSTGRYTYAVEIVHLDGGVYRYGTTTVSLHSLDLID